MRLINGLRVNIVLIVRQLDIVLLHPVLLPASYPILFFKPLIKGATEGLVLASNGPSPRRRPNDRSLSTHPSLPVPASVPHVEFIFQRSGQPILYALYIEPPGRHPRFVPFCVFCSSAPCCLSPTSNGPSVVLQPNNRFPSLTPPLKWHN